MAGFAHRSIRSALARAILWTTGGALAATLVVVGVLEWRLFQSEQESRLDAIGAVAASYSVAALEFDDPVAGAEALAALGASRDVTFAAILRPRGEVFATYGSLPGGDDVKKLARVVGVTFHSSHVDWVRPITARNARKGGVIGILVIRADT